MKQKYIKKTIFYLCISVYILLCVLSLAQCFVLSGDADLVGMRHYDDLAFQMELNSRYTNFSFDSFINMNGYGYGWIYWFLVMIYCFPGWRLCRYFQISWLLLVTPRLVSVLLSFASVFVFYKLICLYTEEKAIRLTAVFLMPLFPTLNFYSSLFSCNPHVAFLSLLAVYFMAKSKRIDQDRAMFTKALRYSLIFLALAIGIKLTSVLILPIYGLLLLNRINFSLKGNIKLLVMSAVQFLLLTFAFISPQFYLGLFNKLYMQRILSALSWAMEFGSEGTASFITNVTDGILKSTYFWPIYFILLLFLLVEAIYEAKVHGWKDNDFLCYLFGYLIAAFLLCFKIRHGSLFIIYYYTAICFAVPLGLVLLGHLKNKTVQKSILTLLCIAQCLFIVQKINAHASDNFFFYYQNAQQQRPLIEEILELRDTVSDTYGNSPMKIAFDGATLHFINSTKHPNATVYTIWQDFKQQSEVIEPDAILMTKAWLTTEYADQNPEDFAARSEFLETKNFNGATYKLLKESEHYLLFSRK